MRKLGMEPNQGETRGWKDFHWWKCQRNPHLRENSSGLCKDVEEEILWFWIFDGVNRKIGSSLATKYELKLMETPIYFYFFVSIH